MIQTFQPHTALTPERHHGSASPASAASLAAASELRTAWAPFRAHFHANTHQKKDSFRTLDAQPNIYKRQIQMEISI